ncbi:signal peptidase I [bacterium]|nr:signal peptidase I [bacterium]
MSSETTSTSAEDSGVDKAAPAGGQEAPRTLRQRLVHEIRETALTVAVFLPFWLVFTTFAYELRSIPSESMVPALQVGDRVAVSKFAYGYTRNSVPFGIGRWLIPDDPTRPDERLFARMPKRGDVAVFQHPNDNRVMIKRVVGLPGDRIQVVAGRLTVNGEPVEREQIAQRTYIPHEERGLWTATEYRETLPGEAGSHLIHEWSDDDRYDQTPIFRVPDGHLFFMGDNRDNSEDSRAPTGHPGLAALEPYAWPNVGMFGGPKAIGYVPLDHLIGRADTVVFTLHRCTRAPGAECPAPRLWRGL